MTAHLVTMEEPVSVNSKHRKIDNCPMRETGFGAYRTGGVVGRVGQVGVKCGTPDPINQGQTG